MQENFELCMPKVFNHEGGYVNNRKDPGGETNLGITHRTLRTARKTMADLPARVGNLTREQAARIYHKFYWQPVSGHLLPSGVDYVAFDGSINSGPARGAKWVQSAAGAKADGVMGPKSVALIHSCDAVEVIERATDNRRGFLRGLSTFTTFGVGWSRRVNEVEAFALKLAVGSATSAVIARADRRAASAKDKVTTTAAGGTAATGGTAAIDLSQVPEWAPWAVGAVMLLLVINQIGRMRQEKARARVIKETLA